MDKVGAGDDAGAMLDYGNLSPRDVAPIHAVWWLNGQERSHISTTISRIEARQANLRSRCGMVCSGMKQ